jgi:hypothetical protein
VSSRKEGKDAERARNPEGSANTLELRPGLRVHVGEEAGQWALLLSLDEVVLAILHDREPNGNYRYTTRVEAGRKRVEREVKRESILTGDSGRAGIKGGELVVNESRLK